MCPFVQCPAYRYLYGMPLYAPVRPQLPNHFTSAGLSLARHPCVELGSTKTAGANAGLSKALARHCVELGPTKTAGTNAGWCKARACGIQTLAGGRPVRAARGTVTRSPVTQFPGLS